MSTFRTSFAGSTINYLSSGRLLPHIEERPDFVVPSHFTLDHSSKADPHTLDSTRVNTPELKTPSELQQSAPASDVVLTSLAKIADLEKQSTAPEIPRASLDSSISESDIVGWYDDQDPENPQNWPFSKKVLATIVICALTFGVYMGSAVYTSSIPGLIRDWHISGRQGSAGLTLFVAGYGIGPLFLSPLSEIPSIGRNGVYIPSLLLFVILGIPAALAPNWNTLMAMRFLTGFFGSPALATGGATLSDMWQPMQVPYAISIWAIGAVAGPVLGPVMGGYAAQALGWRMPMWILLIAAGLALATITFFLPETLPGNILLRRAQRLRKITGNQRLRSQSEIDQAKASLAGNLAQSLWRPLVLAAEPSILFANLYLALAYGIFYLWFESFPIVFGPDGYNFSEGAQGLPYLGIAVGAAITLPLYMLYLKYVIERRFLRTGVMIPEDRLEIGLIAAVFIPMSLFIFGWTARKSVPWIAPIIGATLYLPGLFLLFQSVLTYLPMSYQRHAASVLAGNAFFRSIVAAAFPLFGTSYFKALGVGPGSSILAGISILMIPFLYLLKRYGAVLRARSKHAD